MQKHVLALVGLTLIAACSSRQPAAAPPPPAPPPGASDNLTLAERLAREAASRTAGGPRAEEVAAALARAGVEVRSFQQVLARTVTARFCMAGHTESGLAVAVCEFSDDADAARGLAYSRQRFDALVPDRRLERNGKAVLTLTRASTGNAVDAEVTRAATVFASL
jgi:hypothetical protein